MSELKLFKFNEKPNTHNKEEDDCLKNKFSNLIKVNSKSKIEAISTDNKLAASSAALSSSLVSYESSNSESD